METKEATLVFLSEADKILMIYRDKNPQDFLYGKWTPPGGKLERAETLEECAKREFYEETNLQICNLIYRGKVLFDNAERTFGGRPAKYNWMVHIYETSVYQGQLKTSSREGTPRWVSESELATLPMEDGDGTILRMLKSPEEIAIRIIHIGTRFDRYEQLVS